MKNYLNSVRLSVAILVAFQMNQAARGQILLNENFDYPAGVYLTANGWTSHSGSGTNAIAVGSPGLVFPGYPSSGIGLSAMLSTTGEDVNKTFATVLSGPVYCAFLIRVNTIDNQYFLHLAGSPAGTNYKGRVSVEGSGTTFNFGLSKGAEATVYTTTSSFTTGTVYLLVLKYTIADGSANDAVSLFVIDGTIPGSEPASPALGPGTDVTQPDLSNVSAIALRQNSVSQNIQIDGIRITTRWEDAVSGTTGMYHPDPFQLPLLYPNPVSTELVISHTADITKVEIFDLTGKRMTIVENRGSGQITIPVNDYMKGLYLVRLHSGDRIRFLKFVKS